MKNSRNEGMVGTRGRFLVPLRDGWNEEPSPRSNRPLVPPSFCYIIMMRLFISMEAM